MTLLYGKEWLSNTRQGCLFGYKNGSRKSPNMGKEVIVLIYLKKRKKRRQVLQMGINMIHVTAYSDCIGNFLVFLYLFFSRW